MDRKLLTIQRELSESKDREKLLKLRVGVWRDRAIKERRMLKVMTLQYERMLRDFRKIIDDFKSNAFKLFALTLYERYKNWREGVKK